MILTQFDPEYQAIINPKDLVAEIDNFPKTVVTCFARATFNRVLNALPHRLIATTSVANLDIPIYELDVKGHKLGFFNSYVGAAGCVGVLEDIIAMGMKRLLVFGTCGVLDATISENSIIIPTSAIRDEGTSYHYQPASHDIAVNQAYLTRAIDVLEQHSQTYTLGKTWTTDGIYRETRDKMIQRKQEGAICVDMECSAIAALAAFRQLEHFQFFYSADNLDADTWDARSLANEADLEAKDNIAFIALELALRLFKDN
ncbi:TPA: nucleoside phosphorylase [Streptococcus equi subsp. zooepidemicus]|nr:nucleoside phosphorylase [Streptococcus equi subsp. zooepidemicus]HEL0712326.1 nucleoside phosphorylase [Streptococcus equi subsp. zooepidemicus]HEL0737543.1 nucleoside phosphorylase [Streptococcus equi subsp. zooepidemicus]HEL0768394.1 nucleoside phosphorylase [Streptococcus equi subsp. zooepidemicus]HEL1302168.1 nucleoside phosphorylase [Streptococcus equi subsp. zooepidemicus]